MVHYIIPVGNAYYDYIGLIYIRDKICDILKSIPRRVPVDIVCSTAYYWTVFFVSFPVSPFTFSATVPVFNPQNTPQNENLGKRSI